MNRLRDLREDLDMTQADVGNAIGVTAVTVGRYELGQRQLTPDLIAKFCALYHVSADYLLGFSDEEDATDSVTGAYQPNRLRQVRNEHGFTQAEVGNAIGLSAAAIGHYESGKRSLTAALIAKFCALYQVSADYLLGLSDVRAPGAAPAAEPAVDTQADTQTAGQSGAQASDVQAMAEMISRFTPEQTELFLQVLALIRRGQGDAGK